MSMKNLRERGAEALTRLAAGRTNTSDGSSSFDGGSSSTPPQTPRRAITAPGARALLQPEIDLLNERAQQAEQALAKLEDQQQANPVELELERIVEVPGRRRRLTPAEFAELRANLEANELVHPVVVRLLPGSSDTKASAALARYELISGYNRLDVFRLLGRRTIPVRVLGIGDDQVDGAAFWSNLLQPSLPDYEKFLGLRQYRDQHNLSDAELARRAGVSKALISYLMSFGKLPAGAIELLDANPRLLGSDCARRLVKVAENGRSAAVVEALTLLSAGEIASQEQAVVVAEQGAPQVKPAEMADAAQPSGRKVLASTVQICSGALTLCRMVSKGTSLRLEFKLDEHRQRAQEIVEQAMADLAAKLAGLEDSGSEG